MRRPSVALPGTAAGAILDAATRSGLGDHDIAALQLRYPTADARAEE